jgi:hypothetical protein
MDEPSTVDAPGKPVIKWGDSPRVSMIKAHAKAGVCCIWAVRAR